ncbi:MAG: NAD(P)-dependent alcohol dehydrogenase [Acidimicrobiia bacterium]|nr:NAD(P)-dependent alcohol dehydrogenase [Acidimicrobiia bacterium]
MMRAVVYGEYGSTNALHVIDVPTPTPAADQVLVRVGATSVNSWDWDLIEGGILARLEGGLREPRRRILGIDVAGTVVGVGQHVTSFVEGDEVFGDLSGVGFGAFAEYVVAPAGALARKSPSLTFVQAAAVPHAGLLALQGLRGKRSIEPGDKVLINGAGGGVGSFAIPLARKWGAEVTGVDREEKLEAMQTWGAHHVIDYEAVDFTRTGIRYDLIFDVTSRRTVLAYPRALAVGGSSVVVGGSIPALLSTVTMGTLLTKATDRQYSVLVHRPNPDDLDQLNGFFEAGLLEPVIDSIWSLDQIRDAVQLIADGAAKGKVVVTV